MIEDLYHDFNFLMTISHDCGGIIFYNLQIKYLQKSFNPGIVALIADCIVKLDVELY